MVVGISRALVRTWFALPLAGLALACGSRAPAAKTPATASAVAKPTPSAPAKSEAETPRPADAGDTATYYDERAPLLAKGDTAAIAATDFVRLRRGRLYSKAEPIPRELDRALQAAMEKDDPNAVLDAATKILAYDETDARAHIVSAAVLRQAGAAGQSDIHATLAKALLDSLGKRGDGATFETAWTAYAVKEEYQFLFAIGLEVHGQRLVGHGDRSFDVLAVVDPKSGRSGEAYFDVTELFAEEGRMTAPH
ncbi:MAG TPA: DUF4919 domain-containing protein [Polyangiaceae bacterium]|nr:DUF4919 domain-containing protein [Polyangiaceae bacterium]